MKPTYIANGFLLALVLALQPAILGEAPSPTRAATADTPANRSDTKPNAVAGLKGRIFVAVQTAPGSSLVDEEKDPYRGTAILAVDPDTGTSECVVDKATQPRLSADGRTLVYSTAKGIAVRTPEGASRLIRSLDPEMTALVLSADGKEIIYSVRRSRSGKDFFSYDSWRCAVAGGEPTKLPIPNTDQVIDWSPDGRWLLTLRWPRDGGGEQLLIMRPNATEQRQFSHDSGLMSMARFSPDGKRIVYMHQDRNKNALWVMDSDGRHRTKVVDYRPDWHPWACWSPDGKRLAVVDCKPPRGAPPTDYHLDVMDADGCHRRTLKLPKALYISAADWRPVPQPPAKSGRLLFYRMGYLTLISPDGKDEKQVSKNRDEFFPVSACLSPDGKRIAALVPDQGGLAAEGREPRRRIYVRGLNEPEPGADLKVEGQDVCWSPDGMELIAVEYVYGKDSSDLKFVNWLVNVTTKRKTVLKLPENHAVKDWSGDGKHFLTTAYELKKQPTKARLYLMNRDGTEAKALTDGTESCILAACRRTAASCSTSRLIRDRRRKTGIGCSFWTSRRASRGWWSSSRAGLSTWAFVGPPTATALPTSGAGYMRRRTRTRTPNRRSSSPMRMERIPSRLPPKTPRIPASSRWAGSIGAEQFSDICFRAR